ncbi:phage holin family protein [Haloechinothrix halophila]|uniref:phage holin family protein n=1 Tax=Haloechinothrix halophila TaxID=1069073 RepID=UPI00041B2207|nr:phage holin family protein [Haloechinothrix halophila]
MTATETTVEANDNGHERSTAHLVKDVSQQTSHLMRAEAKLAVHEVTAKAKRAAAGAGLLAAAGVIALYGGAGLLAALIMVIAIALPGWAAALIVGGGLVVLGAVLGLIGALLVRKAAPPTPEDTITSVKTDVETVKEGARR